MFHLTHHTALEKTLESITFIVLEPKLHESLTDLGFWLVLGESGFRLKC